MALLTATGAANELAGTVGYTLTGALNKLVDEGGIGGGTVAWDDVTDKPTTFTPSAHTHPISQVTDLQTSLDGKAASSHQHAAGDITSGTLAAARIPTLAQSKVSGLEAALAGLDRVAANVGDADPTDLSTVAASIDAIRDALVAAGLMAPAA